jgi:hypothetical protein
MTQIIIDISYNREFIETIRTKSCRNFANIANDNYYIETIRNAFATINPYKSNRHKLCVEKLAELPKIEFVEKNKILTKYFKTNKDNMNNPLTKDTVNNLRLVNRRLATVLEDIFPDDSFINFPDLFEELYNTKLQCGDDIISFLDIFLAYESELVWNITINNVLFRVAMNWRFIKHYFSSSLFLCLVNTKLFNMLDNCAIDKIYDAFDIAHTLKHNNIYPELIHI